MNAALVRSLLLLSLVATGSCSGLASPFGCKYQFLNFDWPVTRVENGIARKDSLFGLAANSNYAMQGGVFEAMRSMLIDGEPASGSSGVSWGMPLDHLSADGSVFGFTHQAPLNVGDSLPIVLGSANPTWTALNVPPDRVVRASFFTYGDDAQIRSASGYLKVLQRTPFSAMMSITATRADGKTFEIRGPVTWSAHRSEGPC